MDAPPQPKPVRGRRLTRFLSVITIIAALACAGVMTRQWWRPAPQIAGPKSIGPLPNCLVFSPDRASKFVAAAFSDGRLGIWETATKKEIPIKLPSQWPLNDLAWLPGSEAVLTGGFEQHVLMCNLKSGQVRKLPKLDAPVVSIAVRPGKPELLISLANGELHWLQMKTAARGTVPTDHKGIVKIVRYSPDGQTFVTGGADGQLIWHNAETRQVTKKVAAHDHELSTLAFSSNGQHLATGSWDNTAKIWLADGILVGKPLNHPGGVSHVDWQKADLITSCWDGRLRQWNISSGEVIHERDALSTTLVFAVWPDHAEVAEVAASGTLNLRPF